MKPWTALAWKEARQIASEVVALIVLVVVVPAAAVLVPGDVREAGLGWIASSLAAVIAALVLGAGLVAGDLAPGFLRSRAIGSIASLMTRLAVRFASFVIVLAVAHGVAVAGGFVLPPEARLLALSFIGLCFLGAALASAFTKRALAATLFGAVVATITMLPVIAVAAHEPGESFTARGLCKGFAVAAAAFLLALAAAARLRRDVTVDPARVLKKVAGIAVAITLALLTAWVLIGRSVANARIVAAIQRWQAEVDGARVVPPRPVPRRSADAAEADAIGRRLGLPLAQPSWGAGRSELALPVEVRQAMDVYRHPDLLNGPMPWEVSEFLRAHATDVDALRTILLRGEVTWDAGLDAAPHLHLARLLAFDAIEKHSAGDRDGALTDLRAIREVTRTLRRHPDLLPRLVACSISTTHARVARRIGAGQEWIDGEAVEEIAGELRDGVSWEVADTLAIAEGRRAHHPWAPRPPPLERVAEILVSPRMRDRAAADIIDAIDTAQRVTWANPCDTLTRVSSAVRTDIPRNLEHLGVFQGSAGCARRAARLIAEWDLTRVTTRIEEWRRVQPGEAIPQELLASAACPGMQWRVETLEGREIIRPWHGVIDGLGELPLEHVISAR